MRVDLHNHTIYCNHASGSMQEYIQKATEIGIDIFGFSCHAPMEFDKRYRMSFEVLDKYINDIKELNAKSPQIEILSALEVDYILGREDLLSKKVLDAPLDYLIGSVHFLGDWGFDNPEFIGQWNERGIEKTWSDYLDSIDCMVKTRLFQIVGHLDLPKVFGSKIPKSFKSRIIKTLELIKENDIVIEINAAGLRKDIGEQYPSYDILESAKKLGIDITLSSDAHSIAQVGFGYKEALDIAKKVGYNQVAIFREKKKFLVDI